MRTLKIQLLVLPCVMLLFAAAAQAEVLRGKVVSVIDGDTLTIMDGQNHKHLVQIAGIAAPEPGQNYSKHARQNLWRLVGQREVVARFVESLRPRGVFANISVHEADGDLDVGLAQIRAGLAWYNFDNSLSGELQAAYLQAESEARKATSGLWRDPHATAPWEFLRLQHAEVYYETVPGF